MASVRLVLHLFGVIALFSCFIQTTLSLKKTNIKKDSLTNFPRSQNRIFHDAANAANTFALQKAIPTVALGLFFSISTAIQFNLPAFATEEISVQAQPFHISDAEDKTTKQFELCLSKCVFAETRPPPVGASSERLESRKTRGEILRECKSKCATSKDQLLTGNPKKKSSTSSEINQ